ncbi:endoplasmic reticulum-Golgi intermediate compartment protein 1 isoform X1 [Ailuropoda melanoleuca]|uniref:endoplasmic reticulum-Golgi intermediate compartment protein 1 isoform X1 n=1 Tax=Ailuropoda melanoleuca TaxID=9646 RepID=UPI0014948AED|nr:endoplasmic reticulum-Golgi intermediate compartment protein 1 isoform X1 [Ailuropoda melanoleuca]
MSTYSLVVRESTVGHIPWSPQGPGRFDIYRKVPKDLTQPTYTGAIISICCCLFILFLFLSELTGFITTEVVNELYVDDPDKDSGGKIDVSLNISLPNLHCELVGLDIQDEMGRHEVGHIDNSMKIPLNNGAGCRFEGQFSINKVPGNFHVSTHSATAQPQNPDMTHVIHKLSFGDTLQRFCVIPSERGPAVLTVPVHLDPWVETWSLGKGTRFSRASTTCWCSLRASVALRGFSLNEKNLPIHHPRDKYLLSTCYGHCVPYARCRGQAWSLPVWNLQSGGENRSYSNGHTNECEVQNVHGAFNALGGADRLTSNPLASHDYILKIVPTVYEDKSGKQRYSYQYTVANKEYVAYSHTGRIIPAIWFRYDLSPITVKYTERRQPLYRFITTICAIIGGTFTVAGILDSCIFTASEAWKKIQLGKMH